MGEHESVTEWRFVLHGSADLVEDFATPTDKSNIAQASDGDVDGSSRAGAGLSIAGFGGNIDGIISSCRRDFLKK